MAAAVGFCSSFSSSSAKAVVALRRKRRTGGAPATTAVRCVASSFYSAAGVADPYRTLRIQPGSSEKEVRQAFRQLALQYHPDVCKGSNCGVQFHRINEAYDVVMSSLRASAEPEEEATEEEYRHDSGWELWEEWMGWEGACTQDYAAHINPYI